MKKENQYRISFEIDIFAESHVEAARKLKEMIEFDTFGYIVNVKDVESEKAEDFDLSLDYPYVDEPLTEEEVQFLKRQANFMNEKIE